MSITHNYVTNAPRQSASLPMAARVLFKLLPNLRHGRLTVTLPDRSQHDFGHDGQGIHAHLDIRDLAICSQVLTGGDVAFGEGYFNGLWDTPDLPALLTLLARNQNELMPAFYGRGWKGWLFRLRHILRANSRKQAKKNIEAHYDLGNTFYRVWLDATMTYSSALFERDRDVGLDVAQTAKYERILNEINPPAGGHILEIGCGWGGFAEHAAKTRGVRVTGITLSSSQLEYARERIARAGLQSLVRLELCDYRDVAKRLGAQFDGVASIEMFEAVGERWWPTYFKTIAKSLKPGGRAVVQSITIRDDLFADYRKGTDFIQQYVFPGGMLPSRTAFRAAAAKQGLVVHGEYAFGEDYARTLAEWRHAFEAKWPQIAALGFDENFRRLWRMYLCYCEAGFLAGNVDVVHFELAHR